MVAIRSALVLLLAVIALAAIPSSAGAQSRYCGSYSRNTSIYALHVTCRTAYHVIRNFVCDPGNDVTCGFTGRAGTFFTGRSGDYRCAYVFHAHFVYTWTCRKRNFVVSWRPAFPPRAVGPVRG
jgi:hypothetical protein